MIDSHCHLDSDRLADDLTAHLDTARAAGVAEFVLAGTDEASWERQSRLASQHPDLWPVYGIHPWWAGAMATHALEAALGRLDDALSTSVGGLRRPVAIGETGLDRSKFAPANSLGPQTVAFRAHLELAARHKLPVVLHILKAHEEALRVLTAVGVPCGGVVHSYSGSAALVPRYEALGLHISLSGAVARPQSRKLRAAAAAISQERLLIETDAPDQPPYPHRGECNRPALLALVRDAVAEARGVSAGAIAMRTATNARRLFGLPE